MPGLLSVAGYLASDEGKEALTRSITPKQHLKLTQWQIAALEKLVRDHLKERADEPSNPWLNGMQGISDVLYGAEAIVVTKPKRR